MTITPAAARQAQPTNAQPTTPPKPMREIVDRFASAVKQGAIPLPPSSRAAEILEIAGQPPQRTPARPHGLPATIADAAPRRPRLDPETPDLTLAAGVLAALAGMAAAAPPPATIDPSAFADLMNQLWLREQQRTTKELRVRFGDAAWPATGARILRHDDGSLAVEVSIGRHGNSGDLDALQRQFTERGLAVASIIVASES